MSAYKKFSEVYDRLMKPDFNYNEWVDYIENIFFINDKNPNLVAELACGTGNITIPMSKRGYDMIGIDKSLNMLDVAKRKADNESQDILFLNQDITNLDLFGTCDAFLCMIDGINYIIDAKKLKYMFTKIKTCFIEKDGIFIFDISSKYKLSNVIGNNTFIYNTDEVFYTWENSFNEKHGISKMDLNFFIKDEKKEYRRFEEIHIQKAYTISQIEKLLYFAGFSNVIEYSPLTFEKPKEDDERIVFVAFA